MRAPSAIGAASAHSALRSTGDQNGWPARRALAAMLMTVIAADAAKSAAQTARAEAALAGVSQGAPVTRKLITTAARASKPTHSMPLPEMLLSRPAASRVRRM